MDFDFGRAAPDPVALMLAPMGNGGVTIGYRDRSGRLHGCRDCLAGPAQADVVAAWVAGAEGMGLAIEDLRPGTGGEGPVTGSAADAPLRARLTLLRTEAGGRVRPVVGGETVTLLVGRGDEARAWNAEVGCAAPVAPGGSAEVTLRVTRPEGREAVAGAGRTRVWDDGVVGVVEVGDAREAARDARVGRVLAALAPGDGGDDDVEVLGRAASAARAAARRAGGQPTPAAVVAASLLGALGGCETGSGRLEACARLLGLLGCAGLARDGWDGWDRVSGVELCDAVDAAVAHGLAELRGGGGPRGGRRGAATPAVGARGFPVPALVGTTPGALDGLVPLLRVATTPALRFAASLATEGEEVAARRMAAGTRADREAGRELLAALGLPMGERS